MADLSCKLPLSENTVEVMQFLCSNPKVKKALEQAKLQEPYTIEEQIEICEVAAPPMKEAKRAELIHEKMRSYGLDAEIDPVGNVIGRYKGMNPEAPVCVVCAHIDTAFPEGTDVRVRRQGGKLYAPGISDDTRGLACMLQVIRLFVSNDIRTQGDVVFIGTVGEEAEGDLRGVKRIFYSSGIHVDGVIAIDSADTGKLLYGSTGSKRYKVEYTGPGGSSFTDFGKVPNPISALCRAGVLLSSLEVPKNPRTTYSIGTIQGGSVVNVIADHAQCELDLRSDDNGVLNNLVSMVLPMFEQAADLENDSIEGLKEENKINCKITPLGYRPAGMQNSSSPVLQAARAAQEALGIPLTSFTSASTDQNVPMSLGIPSTTIGGGGIDYGNHSLSECYEPKDSYLGPQLCLLSVLSLVGLENGPAPMLEIYSASPKPSWSDKL